MMEEEKIMKKLEEIQHAIVSLKEEVLSELTGKISLLEEKLENEVGKSENGKCLSKNKNR